MFLGWNGWGRFSLLAPPPLSFIETRKEAGLLVLQIGLRVVKSVLMSIFMIRRILSLVLYKSHELASLSYLSCPKCMNDCNVWIDFLFLNTFIVSFWQSIWSTRALVYNALIDQMQICARTVDMSRIWLVLTDICTAVVLYEAAACNCHDGR